MTGFTFTFCGESLIADPSGALIWPAQRTLVVSDLHLGKGRVLAARSGTLLPPYDTSETLERLRALIDRSEARRVISLGDSFDHLEVGLDAADLVRLRQLVQAQDWVWVLGNHDRALPHKLAGDQVEDLAIGPLTFRHEALAGSVTGEISGHFHPKAAIRIKGRRIRGKCILYDGNRLMVPAFGTYTGGLDMTDPAIRSLFAPGVQVLLCHRQSVYPLPSAARVV